MDLAGGRQEEKKMPHMLKKLKKVNLARTLVIT